jgi:exopolysaccharide biosynthesis polyprenyl glycosylphosphotransferase
MPSNPQTSTIAIQPPQPPPRAPEQSASISQPARRKHRATLGVARQDWAVGFGLAAVDVISWILLYGFISYLRRDEFFVGPFEFLIVDVVQVVVMCQALFVIGGYDRNKDMWGLTYMAEHILAIIAAAIISSLLVYSAAAYDHTMKPSRAVILLSFLVFLPWSLLYRRALRPYLFRSAAGRAFLVIGGGEVAARFYEAYRRSPTQQRLEFVDLERERIGQPVAGSGSPIVEGDIATKLANLNDRYSGVILAERVDRLHPELLEHLVRTQFQRARVYTLESFYEAHWRHVPIDALDPFWPLQMGFQLARNSPYHYLKRLFDVVASAVLLIISAPVMGAAAGLIWLTDGRPILFRQPRVGREGEIFTVLKFRTMKLPTGEPSEEDIYTRANDPRITTLGRVLRKLRFDELPQLFNVLSGEMSLIGPRAEWTKCAERYEKKIPFYHFRHLVKPGITGWAQVNYPYGESEADAIEKLKYDLYYIRHYSLKLDAMIALKTVHTMLFGKGR